MLCSIIEREAWIHVMDVVVVVVANVFVSFFFLSPWFTTESSLLKSMDVTYFFFLLNSLYSREKRKWRRHFLLVERPGICRFGWNGRSFYSVRDFTRIFQKTKFFFFLFFFSFLQWVVWIFARRALLGEYKRKRRYKKKKKKLSPPPHHHVVATAYPTYKREEREE